MRNNFSLKRSVGDTIPQFAISIEQDKLESVTLNIIFSLLTPLSMTRDRVGSSKHPHFTATLNMHISVR